ncbi:tyrosine-type recombinase/integrase [Glutamicibacter sp. NPDC087344]|uniref:tyrosine-type recombinase/integrase n=1 Tax=Glutamicibacter sp. NPDC087344 TaxID=3363994 RepID=UPI00381605E1
MTTSEPRAKRGNQEGSEPRLRADGRWQANYVAGYKPSGHAILKSAYGKTKAEYTRKLREALREVHAGQSSVGLKPRLIEWLDYWLANIAPATAKSPQTRKGYSNKINSHIRPHRLAGKRLDKLTPSDFEVIYAAMREAGLSETSLLGLHAILRRALNMAVKRGVLGKNPILLLDAPSPEPFEPQVYSTEEVRRMIAATKNQDDEARWLLNLMLGPRQGEALGLTWSDIDFENGKIRIERELFVLPWEHGCNPDDPLAPKCGRKFGRQCPMRRGGGHFTGAPKGAAGVRSVTMPGPLRQALLRHAEARKAIRAYEPRTVWKDQEGWSGIWCSVGRAGCLCIRRRTRRHGGSCSPKRRYLQGASTTAATTMLLLGVPQRVVLEILGWSQISMLQRYQHVLDEMHQDVADKLAAHWAEPEPEPKPHPDNVISLQDRFRNRGNYGA